MDQYMTTAQKIGTLKYFKIDCAIHECVKFWVDYYPELFIVHYQFIDGSIFDDRVYMTDLE